jgi:uncharacterized membrane protein
MESELMGLDPLTQMSGEYLVTQGILGICVMALAVVVIYLWRDSKAQRRQFDEDLLEERNRSATELVNERSRHAVEIAAYQRLNHDLQESRLNELRAALDAVKSVTATVDSALLVLQGRER